jgi:hypothetical protein
VSYIHVTAFEATNTGAESVASTSVAVIDNGEDPNLPAISSMSFVDEDGTSNQVLGNITFVLPTGTVANTARVVLYLATGSDEVDIVSEMFTYTVNGSTVDGQTVTFRTPTPISLQASSEQYLTHVLARTVGTSGGTNTAATHIIDRSDSLWFLAYFLKHSAAVGTSEIYYYPTAAQTADTSGEPTSGSVSLTWVLPNLSNTIYAVSEGGDGQPLSDLQSVFMYDIAIGSSTAVDMPCSLVNVINNSPDVPYGGITASDITTASSGTLTNITVTATYDSLMSCGMTASTTDALTLQGSVIVSIATFTSTSTSLGVTPQVQVRSLTTLEFDDSTHATTSDLTIQNLFTIDSISHSLQLPSRVRLYNSGFVSLRTSYSYQALTDDIYLEHAILSNEDLFYLDLERVWFTSDASPTSTVESQLTPPFTNQDQPAEPGRFRLQTQAPLIMNCQPCYMHVQSFLSSASPQKAMPDDRLEGETIVSTKAVVIDVSYEARMLASEINGVSQGVTDGVVTLVAMLGIHVLLYL